MNQKDKNKESLLIASKNISVLSYLSYRAYLEDLYQYTQSSETPVSFKSMSLFLGFGETNSLWLFITGRRKISFRSGEKIAMGLNFSAAEKKYFHALIKYNNCTSAEKRELLFRSLVSLKSKETNDIEDKRILEYFSEWYHPIIREMSTLSDFRADADWLKKKLFVKLRPLQIKKSIELLVALGFLKRDKDGTTRKGDNTQIFPEQSSKNIAMVRYHQKICEITRDSISQVPDNLRDLNTLTVSLTDESAREAQRMIHDLCMKIMQLEEANHSADRIYQFNLQSFALTKKEEKAQSDEDKS